MSDITYYPYFGSGKLHGRLAGAAAGFKYWGNASKIDITVKEKKVSQQDFSKLGGGVYSSVSRIESASLTMVLADLNSPNITRSIFGTDYSIMGGAVVDEVLVAYLDSLIPIAHPNPTAVSVKDGATGLISYVEGTDYEVTPGGIFVIGGGAILAADPFKVSYTYGAYNKIEAMTGGAPVVELHFEGLNEALSGKPVIVDIWRLQLSPAKVWSLVGDKFADLTIDGEVLCDNTKTGVGVSKYFRALQT